jgi:hypothetical protein
VQTEFSVQLQLRLDILALPSVPIYTMGRSSSISSYMPIPIEVVSLLDWVNLGVGVCLLKTLPSRRLTDEFLKIKIIVR